METLIMLAFFTAVGCWIYQNGKRDGSRRGYGAGRRHERAAWRRRRRR